LDECRYIPVENGFAERYLGSGCGDYLFEVFLGLEGLSNFKIHNIGNEYAVKEQRIRDFILEAFSKVLDDGCNSTCSL